MAHYRWNSAVATRTLDGTAFVLAGGRMVRLDEVGTLIWELLKEGSTVASVAERVAAEYDVEVAQAARDAEQFCESLCERGMLVKAG